MMRLYLTPVDDYLVLSDIQHFNPHLISALLQVHHTSNERLDSGLHLGLPVCWPGAHRLLGAEAAQESYLTILCH